MSIIKKKWLSVAMVSLLSVGMIGCTNQDMGTISGAAIGGLIGSQFGGGSGQILATGAGMLIGAGIGNSIGRSMDKQSQQHVHYAMDSGQQQNWVSPDGVHYDMRPGEKYSRNYQGHSRTCREYQTQATISGKTQTIYGTACLMDDGEWQVIS